MRIKLGLLFILSLFTISVYGNSYTAEQLFTITSIKNSMTYWEILLDILYIFLLTPLVYLAYLRFFERPDKFKPYYFKGEYNANSIIDYIEKLEVLLQKSFPKFKNSIVKCNEDSSGNIGLYAEAIDSNIFCIKLNGKKRLTVFWNFSDSFLKVIILLLPIIGALIVFVSYIYWGVVGLVFSIVLQIFIMPLMLVFFSYLLQFCQYIFRKVGTDVFALNISLFAVEALINRNVVRTYDKKIGDYFYYSIITKYNNLVNVRSDITGVFSNPNSAISGIINDYNVEIE